jgi:predicted CoA-substrate-specific enzyme activase
MVAYVLGIDFGSTTGKAVILDENGGLVAAQVSQKGAVSDEGVKAALAGALAEAGVRLDQIARTVSTGYGRRMLDMADRTITEITCHARGAVAMIPEARLVIDIGGQDSKVIAIDANGLVARFAMNDRCAAGTGKFLETLARAVNVNLDDMGDLALQASREIAVSSMCATFAETEVIALLSEGVAKIDVLGGVHAAVAKRTLGLVTRVGKTTPIVMTGGVARNRAAVAHIERVLGCSLILPDRPQIAGALGAAWFALDDYRQQGESRRRAAMALEHDVEQAEIAAQACSPACRSTQGSAQKAAS